MPIVGADVVGVADGTEVVGVTVGKEVVGVKVGNGVGFKVGFPPPQEQQASFAVFPKFANMEFVLVAQRVSSALKSLHFNFSGLSSYQKSSPSGIKSPHFSQI